MFYESEMEFLYTLLEESESKKDMETILDSIDYLITSEVEL